MAAGLGFKTFTTGEVLTSADVNGYLMQGVLVFASEAARDAAITSPQEGQFAFTKDNNSLWYYSGAAWVASGATGDIEGVTAGTGISGGGTSGTVTITNSMATEIDAKGDLVAGTGADAFARIGVGADGTVLTAASGEATGLEWAAPAGGGIDLELIASGSLSGTSLTLSGLTADTMILYIDSPTFVAGPSFLQVRPNNNTGANYTYLGLLVGPNAPTDQAVTNVENGSDGIQLSASTNLSTCFFVFTNCAAAGMTNFTFAVQRYVAGAGTYYQWQGQGIYEQEAQVTSLVFRMDNGATFTGGTYKLIGG